MMRRDEKKGEEQQREKDKMISRVTTGTKCLLYTD